MKNLLILFTLPLLFSCESNLDKSNKNVTAKKGLEVEKKAENTIETEVTLVMQEYGYNGLGTYISDNGNKYVGEWKKGKQHGYGTLTYKDSKGSPDGGYVGEWKNGKFHGHGTLTNKEDYGSYVGEFKNGLSDGQGTQIFEWKSRLYKGGFKDGEWHGHGVLFYLPNGENPDTLLQVKGRWVRGVPVF